MKFRYVLIKYRKIIASVIAWIFNTIGIVLSIFGNINNDFGSVGTVIIVNLIAAEIFFICSIVYSLISLMRDVGRKERMNEAKSNYAKLEDANKKVIENNKAIITAYKDVNDKLNILVNDYEKTIKEIEKEIKHADKIKDDEISKYLKTQRVNEYESFRNSAIGLYNGFNIDVLNYLRSSLESYAYAKGYKCPIAIAIKHITVPVNYADIKEKDKNIYTSFRDSKTYNNKLRNGTWKETYSIYENSDFSHSIAKDYCIFNNISKKSGMYRNETVAYYEHYNSGITYAINSCINGKRKLYGFLACDSMLTDKEIRKNGPEMFDLNMANIMASGAHVIAMFLETFLGIWEKEHNDKNEKKDYYSTDFCNTMKDKVSKARYNG